MKSFIVCDDFFKLFPEACFGVVVAAGVNNAPAEEEVYRQMLREAEKESRRFTSADTFTDNPVIAEWREAFRKFKTKKGARASIEAMLKRVKQGNSIGCISPVVDIYNSISLTYGVPIGAEDIDSFAGDMRLTIADGTEEFKLIGSDENDPPYPGEVIYKDEGGAVCRCFNWRESKRTMVTEDSVNVFSIIEMPNKGRFDELKEAVTRLAGLYEQHLGAKCDVYILDSENNSVVIQ